MKKLWLVSILILSTAGSVFGAEPLTLTSAIKQALSTNPAIKEAEAKAEAESVQIKSKYWLDNPKVGLMRESNMTLMQNQMGDMTSWSVAQEIKFPTKYFAMGEAQSAKTEQAEQEFAQKKLETRTKVISGYYNLFVADRILALLNAQKEALREIARIAESRYATGKAPQQDEMKAHVEQTQIEREIIMAQEERSTMIGMLNAVLSQEATEEITLPKSELLAPKLSMKPEDLPNLIAEHSKHIKEARAMVDEARAEKKLAYWNFAPDFMLTYRKPFGDNALGNAYAVGVEMTIPLWFFTKNTSEAQAASAKQMVAERNLQKVTLDHLAEIRSLTAKVQSTQKLLVLYETGLIPQATSTLNSSRASYRVGKVGFIDLLDSERSLYGVRMAYYRTLSQYVENLTKLEEFVGHSLSSLPFGEKL